MDVVGCWTVAGLLDDGCRRRLRSLLCAVFSDEQPARSRPVRLAPDVQVAVEVGVVQHRVVAFRVSGVRPSTDSLWVAGQVLVAFDGCGLTVVE